MKKLIALLLTLVMAFTLVSCGSSTQTTGEKKVSDTIVLGTSADYPPFEFIYLDDAGKQQYAGIDISLANKIAKDAGKKLKVVNMNFDSLMASLQKGEIDMVIAAIEKTPEREKAADFSDPYYTDLPAMILVKAANTANYTALDSFKDKSVGAQTSTTKADIVNEKLTGAKLVALTSVTDLVNELVYDKCDAIVLDGAVAMQYAASNKDLVVSSVKLGEAAPFRVAVQKGDPSKLLEGFNKTIKTVTSDGTVEKWTKEANTLSEKAIEK